MKTLACPIAFNESAKIRSVLEKFRGTAINEVAVIDDASTDDTAEVVRSFGYTVITQPRRMGVGAGIRRAIEYARAQGFDILVIVAGNDKDRPQEISRLIEPIVRDGFDFVQGSRYLKGGNYGNMPLYRQVLTRWVHPGLFSWVSGMKITDSTNGFRAMRLSLFDDKRIDIHQDWLDKYELEPYLFYKCIRLGYKVKEVPVTKIYPPHGLGYTKMIPFVSWWSILRPLVYLALGIKR